MCFVIQGRGQRGERRTRPRHPHPTSETLFCLSGDKRKLFFADDNGRNFIHVSGPWAQTHGTRPRPVHQAARASPNCKVQPGLLNQTRATTLLFLVFRFPSVIFNKSLQRILQQKKAHKNPKLFEVFSFQMEISEKEKNNSQYDFVFSL